MKEKEKTSKKLADEMREQDNIKQKSVNELRENE